MTDAMSSSDIDRVLANIRKLVSVEDETPPGSGDLLVLTSDLRVVEPENAAKPQAAIGADVSEEAVDVEDVAPTEARWPDPSDERPHLEGAAPEFSPGPLPLNERIGDTQVATSRDPSLEPEPGESDDPDEFLLDRVSQVHPHATPGDRGMVDRDPPDVSPLYLIQAEEAAPSGTFDVPQSDIEGDDGPETHSATSSLPGASDSQFFHTPTNNPFVRAGYIGRDDPLELGEDEAFLDEDALRDLVAEIVREELAGALGERITRNVRKLVRREIMRALSARDFE